MSDSRGWEPGRQAWPAILAALAFLVGGVPSAWGESGGIDRGGAGLPAPPSGLRLTVDSRWGDANGYRPVTITAHPAGGAPFPRDRLLQLEIQQVNYDGPVVHGELQLTAGRMSGATTLLVPQTGPWHDFQLQVKERGIAWRDLELWGGRTGAGAFSEARPTILLLHAAAPTRDMRGGVNAMSAGDQLAIPNLSALANLARTPISNIGPVDLITQVDHLALLPLKEVPTEWLQLTSYDLILVALDHLRELAERHPERWRALGRWNRAGGNLCVFGLGEEFQRLPELEQLLASPAEPNPQSPNADGWTRPNPAEYDPQLLSLPTLPITNPQQYDEFGNPVAPKPTPQPTPPEPNLFRWRPRGLGTVAAFAVENPGAVPEPSWVWYFTSLGGEQTQWYQRHGVSLFRDNHDYWRFLLEGVGLPPTISFRVLITLFALVIGPVNFVVLRRLRRPYLMVLLVPAAAAVITLSLIVYALTADGLGTRVRTRSYTLLDQPSGEAVAWGRQTYYAGLAPSGGLTFDRATAVFPIQPMPLRPAGTREIAWLADGRQQWRQGYLPSRTLSQFLLLRAAPTERKLVIRRHPQGGMAVRNELGLPIRLLLVVDEAGEVSRLADLPPGEAAVAETGPARQFLLELQRLIRENEPRVPEAYYQAGYYNGRSYGYGYRYSYVRSLDYQLPEATFDTSVLGRRFSALGKVRPEALPRRTYYALLDTAPEIPLGVSRVSEEQGFHLVEGRW